MAIYSIIHRWSGRPLLLVEARSLLRALETAAARRAPLPYADLRGLVCPGAFLAALDLRGADMGQAILSGADLRGVDLRAANLVRGYLQEADLRGADLRNADLRGADLRASRLDGARLTGADLRGALFYGASLDGAVLDWRWAGIPRDILRRANRAAGLRAELEPDPVGDAERPFAWLRTILGDPERSERAVAVLGPFIRRADNSPTILRILALDAAPDMSALSPPSPSASPMLWTSRRSPRKGTRGTAASC